MQPEQEIMRHFYDTTQQRTTPAQARKTVSQALNLLEVYTKEEIIECIDYLVKHPPKDGFFSLGFLSYAANEVLGKIKLEKFKQGQLNSFNYEYDNSNEDKNNMKKFIQNKNKKIKGMGRF